ncbi:MAG: hypothetical protein WAX89_01390 [Alphaproteobacteria bacterium]
MRSTPKTLVFTLALATVLCPPAFAFDLVTVLVASVTGAALAKGYDYVTETMADTVGVKVPTTDSLMGADKTTAEKPAEADTTPAPTKCDKAKKASKAAAKKGKKALKKAAKKAEKNA